MCSFLVHNFGDIVTTDFGDIVTTVFDGKIDKRKIMLILSLVLFYTFHIAHYTINTLLNNKSASLQMQHVPSVQ